MEVFFYLRLSTRSHKVSVEIIYVPVALGDSQLFAALYKLSASSTFCLRRMTAVSVRLVFVLLLHLVVKCDCLWGGMTHAVEPYHCTVV